MSHGHICGHFHSKFSSQVICCKDLCLQKSPFPISKSCDLAPEPCWKNYRHSLDTFWQVFSAVEFMSFFDCSLGTKLANIWCRNVGLLMFLPFWGNGEPLSPYHLNIHDGPWWPMLQDMAIEFKNKNVPWLAHWCLKEPVSNPRRDLWYPYVIGKQLFPITFVALYRYLLVSFEQIGSTCKYHRKTWSWQRLCTRSGWQSATDWHAMSTNWVCHFMTWM